MKTLYTFKQFINEESLNEYTDDDFTPPKENNSREALIVLNDWGFKKAVRTNKAAAKKIAEFTGAVMFTHVQYYDIEDRGGELRLHQTQYWINKAEERWGGRKSPQVTLVIVSDIAADDGGTIGSAYVDTNVFLSELKKANITKRVS